MERSCFCESNGTTWRPIRLFQLELHMIRTVDEIYASQPLSTSTSNRSIKQQNAVPTIQNRGSIVDTYNYNVVICIRPASFSTLNFHIRCPSRSFANNNNESSNKDVVDHRLPFPFICSSAVRHAK
jgi:hypothetical protein